ncbi:MAG: hypothetical protein PF570_03085, partial [Candidatus Cloacimonetes bacterium]|nr:hypothetical protein [Candidatus Cloacimonadota bacterium]
MISTSRAGFVNPAPLNSMQFSRFSIKISLAACTVQSEVNSLSEFTRCGNTEVIRKEHEKRDIP